MMNTFILNSVCTVPRDFGPQSITHSLAEALARSQLAFALDSLFTPFSHHFSALMQSFRIQLVFSSTESLTEAPVSPRTESR